MTWAILSAFQPMRSHPVLPLLATMASYVRHYKSEMPNQWNNPKLSNLASHCRGKNDQNWIKTWFLDFSFFFGTSTLCSTVQQHWKCKKSCLGCLLSDAVCARHAQMSCGVDFWRNRKCAFISTPLSNFWKRQLVTAKVRKGSEVLQTFTPSNNFSVMCSSTAERQQLCLLNWHWALWMSVVQNLKSNHGSRLMWCAIRDYYTVENMWAWSRTLQNTAPALTSTLHKRQRFKKEKQRPNISAKICLNKKRPWQEYFVTPEVMVLWMVFIVSLNDIGVWGGKYFNHVQTLYWWKWQALTLGKS